MKINIKATGIELSPALFSYVEKRLAKVEKYLDITEPIMAVELGKSTEHHKQGEIYRAEVRITGGGLDYYATKEAIDIYAAIDEVRDEIIHEITKNKGKKRELLRRGQRAIKNIIRGFFDKK